MDILIRFDDKGSNPAAPGNTEYAVGGFDDWVDVAGFAFGSSNENLGSGQMSVSRLSDVHPLVVKIPGYFDAIPYFYTKTCVPTTLTSVEIWVGDAQEGLEYEYIKLENVYLDATEFADQGDDMMTKLQFYPTKFTFRKSRPNADNTATEKEIEFSVDIEKQKAE